MDPRKAGAGEPLRLPLTEVKEKGSAAVEVSVPPQAVGAALEGGELLGDVLVKGTITQEDEEAAFAGSARGRWRIECARCLAPVESPYAAAVESRVPIDGGPMDLSDDVRQAIVLAQPMKTYCRPDCKGLCPVCRGNRNLADCGHAPAEAGDPPANRPRRSPKRG